jgi:hypothetical protein
VTVLEWLRRRSGERADDVARLRSADEVLASFRADGGDAAAALRWSLRQIEGLRREVEDVARWQRLLALVAKTGDVWNAEDWPYGFDALVCCAPLCARVSFECGQCPVGKRQGSISCAHPQSLFGRIGELVRAADRDGVLAHLRDVELVLREELAALTA